MEHDHDSKQKCGSLDGISTERATPISRSPDEEKPPFLIERHIVAAVDWAARRPLRGSELQDLWDHYFYESR
jgi:hypothetical protein